MARVLGHKQLLRKVKRLGHKIVGKSQLGLKHARRFGKNVKKKTQQEGRAIASQVQNTIEKVKRDMPL